MVRRGLYPSLYPAREDLNTHEYSKIQKHLQRVAVKIAQRRILVIDSRKDAKGGPQARFQYCTRHGQRRIGNCNRCVPGLGKMLNWISRPIT